jgi:hypothetical protein
MPMFRKYDRLGCGMEPQGYSAIKKAGLLSREWCLKCGHRCWMYRGDRFRYIATKPIY